MDEVGNRNALISKKKEKRQIGEIYVLSMYYSQIWLATIFLIFFGT